jgi:hypothetical protein
MRLNPVFMLMRNDEKTLRYSKARPLVCCLNQQKSAIFYTLFG